MTYLKVEWDPLDYNALTRVIPLVGCLNDSTE